MGVLRPIATWRTWDEPGRQIAVVEWVERGICVVFPIAWTVTRGQQRMIGRAKERIREVEAKAAGKQLVAGSVLLAFSEHEEQPLEAQLAPDTPRALL